MALIYNGTTIPNTATINYNGTSLTKIIYNGTTVWQKATWQKVTNAPITINTTTGTYNYNIGKTIRNPKFTCTIAGYTNGTGDRACQLGFSATFGGTSFQSYGYWYDGNRNHTYSPTSLGTATNGVPYQMTGNVQGNTVSSGPWCSGWGDGYTGAGVSSCTITISEYEELK